MDQLLGGPFRNLVWSMHTRLFHVLQPTSSLLQFDTVEVLHENPEPFFVEVATADNGFRSDIAVVFTNLQPAPCNASMPCPNELLLLAHPSKSLDFRLSEVVGSYFRRLDCGHCRSLPYQAINATVEPCANRCNLSAY